MINGEHLWMKNIQECPLHILFQCSYETVLFYGPKKGHFIAYFFHGFWGVFLAGEGIKRSSCSSYVYWSQIRQDSWMMIMQWWWWSNNFVMLIYTKKCRDPLLFQNEKWRDLARTVWPRAFADEKQATSGLQALLCSTTMWVPKWLEAQCSTRYFVPVSPLKTTCRTSIILVGAD